MVQAYIDTWIQGFGLQGYKDTEINRFRVTWIQGYGEIHVCRDKKIQRYMNTRIQI